MMTVKQKLENLEKIKIHLESAAELFEENSYAYQPEIEALDELITQVNNELMDF